MRRTIVAAGVRRQKSILLGIFILIFLVSLSLGTVLTLWTNAASYLSAELDRAGFGTLTAWVSGLPTTEALVTEITALPQVERVETQPLLFSHYRVNEQESDSEGQLIPYDPQNNSYRFFTNTLAPAPLSPTEIAPGEVYVSPSLISLFDIEPGDTLRFALARNGAYLSLTVKGFFEDPFMGSAMIGMKSFLVSPQDALAAQKIIQQAGHDALARPGAMLHIFDTEAAHTTVAQLNSALTQSTSLPRYVEFLHSKTAIQGFMLVLQNAFSGLFLAFILVLLFVVLVALGHSITSNIEAEYKNMGILKALGIPTGALRQMQLLQYATPLVPGMLLGIALTEPASYLLGQATLTTTGLHPPSALPLGITLAAFAVVCAILCAFILLKTGKLQHISPLHAISGLPLQVAPSQRSALKINGTHLSLSLALRQLLTGRKNYIGACIVAILLVFFATTIGRMDTWLGADGAGMMHAFNPADHHLGVQLFGQHTLADAQAVTRAHTNITDSYQLAMVPIAVNGTDYTANVITEPNRFHILEGNTSMGDNEIVVTEFVAKDLGVSIGDTLTVTGDKGSLPYTISGIYACANEMGNNIGLSRAGYQRIATDTPQIWCDHYFLADQSQKATVIQALADRFGGDVHVHENTWPGLTGIVSAMESLIVFMYVMVAFFIIMITTMTASRLLATEQKDLGIYTALGFTARHLRFSFSLRFGITALFGALLGSTLSAAFTDPLVSTVLKFAGISNFASTPSLYTLALPVIFVTLSFFAFAFLAARKIKETHLRILIAD